MKCIDDFFKVDDRKFKVGQYIKFRKRVYVVEDGDDGMLFARDLDTNSLEFFLPFELVEVEDY